MAADIDTDKDGAANRRVLAVAPRLFEMARWSSGAAAIVFEFVRSHELFREAGYESMREYSESRLGVTSESYYKKTARAGVAAWQYLPDLCKGLVAHLSGSGDHGSDPPLLPVPNRTVLALLPSKLPRVPEAVRPALLAKLATGAVTQDELEAAAHHDDSDPGDSDDSTPTNEGVADEDDTGDANDETEEGEAEDGEADHVDEEEEAEEEDEDEDADTTTDDAGEEENEEEAGASEAEDGNENGAAANDNTMAGCDAGDAAIRSATVEAPPAPDDGDRVRELFYVCTSGFLELRDLLPDVPHALLSYWLSHADGNDDADDWAAVAIGQQDLWRRVVTVGLDCGALRARIKGKKHPKLREALADVEATVERLRAAEEQLEEDDVSDLEERFASVSSDRV